MGDPAVIHFWTDTQDEHPLGLYLHWGADLYAEHLADALKLTESRWHDEDFAKATRMAVQAILEARQIGPRDLSAGLFTGTEDHGQGRHTLNVNWGSQTVWTDDWRVSFSSYVISPELWEKEQS